MQPAALAQQHQGGAQRQARLAEGGAATSSGPAEVYLLRGLFNVFSLGMDDLAAKLRASGVAAQTLNHTGWSEAAAEIIAARRQGQNRRIVLIGHSLGGNDIIRLAEKLGRNGVPVDLLIPVDATVPDAIPANVRRVVNYYQSNNGWGSAVQAGPGFRGALVNADLVTNRRDLNDPTIGHTSIDKSGRIHREIVGMVVALNRPPARRARQAARRPAPEAAASAGPAYTGSLGFGPR